MVTKATVTKALSFLRCLSALLCEGKGGVDARTMGQVMTQAFRSVGGVTAQLLHRAKDEVNKEAEDSARQVRFRGFAMLCV